MHDWPQSVEDRLKALEERIAALEADEGDEDG